VEVAAGVEVKVVSWVDQVVLGTQQLDDNGGVLAEARPQREPFEAQLGEER
jgi:hypothetical protein